MYNLSYYEIMLRQNSKTAEGICKIRWDYLKELNPKTVLDYGCGVGWFRAFRPNGAEVDTFDIGPFPQTGIVHDNYDVVCFWDVFEHLPNLSIVDDLLQRTKYVAVSIPIVPERQGFDLSTWKHFKPGEHLHYFTKESLISVFKTKSFELVKCGTPECPPREDIMNFVFKKI